MTSSDTFVVTHEVIYYYLQMFMRILEINALKYMSLFLLIFRLYLD